MNIIDNYIYAFLKGTLDTHGYAILTQWIREDVLHKKYFRDFLIIWKATSIASDEVAFDAEKAFSRFYSDCIETKRVSLYRRMLKISSVAVVVLVCSICVYLVFERDDSTSQVIPTHNCVVEVPAGAKTKITFPDGSVVWLNSKSKIEYAADFAKKSRNVHLSGEGYFEINPNKNLPFVVNTEKLAVEVLGTKFNLKSYEEDLAVQVTLKEGSVKLAQFVQDTDPVLLKPNQRLTYQKLTDDIQVDSVDATHIEDWRNGTMVFYNVPLGEIAKQLRRLYNIPVKIEDSRLESIVYYSDFKGNVPVEKVLEILASGNKFKYEVKPEFIRIYS